MRGIYLTILALIVPSSGLGEVTPVPLPGDGIQPQAATGRDGGVHVVYFEGDPMAGDLYYTRYEDGGFRRRIRVNSEAGSAMAAGSVRGAHLALGRDDRVHVAWMSSGGGGTDGERAMFYARMATDGRSFEVQRDVIAGAYGLDGGGSVAADGKGNVFVAWHAGREEADRRVFVAHSADDGATFAPERAISDPATGACACCGMRAAAGPDGTLYALYRTAREGVHRDMHLVTVAGEGTPSQREVDAWEIGGCPMSTAHLLPGEGQTLAAWETDGQVLFGRYDSEGGQLQEPVAAPGEGTGRKHPVRWRGTERGAFCWSGPRAPAGSAAGTCDGRCSTRRGR